MKEPVLVTGGAGYIGSHTVLALVEAGYPVVVLDDLSAGCRAVVPAGAAFVEGNAGDFDLVRGVIEQHRITAVVHLAARVSVPESMADPLLYYHSNSSASLNLIRACIACGLERFVFSSTAAVYGVPPVVPVSEDAPVMPINPYGNSKLVTEQLLRDVSAAHDFRHVTLRYFNAAGADPKGRAGQPLGGNLRHLVTAACEAATGCSDHVTIFGTDYDTADGTCIRDYIHVSDLADIQVAALGHLEEGGSSSVLNCGYGHGFSVREVLEAVQDAAGKVLDFRDGPRRAGDPPVLVADASKLRDLLGWSPRHDDLDIIVRTALLWMQGRLAAERTGFFTPAV